MMNKHRFRIVEIFQSLQGEGHNSGMDAIFLRFGKCNLNCAWCDTDYECFQEISFTELVVQLQKFTSRNIILTGGEPTIQHGFTDLCTYLKSQGFYLAIESNGLKPIPEIIDYVALSPKSAYRELYVKGRAKKANEVRIVVDGPIYDFCVFIESCIHAQHYYLSPGEKNGVMNWQETILLLYRLNKRQDKKAKWYLNVQTHKLIGIR